MRYLTIILIAGFLVGCGSGGNSVTAKQDGRVYVENAYRSNCLRARLVKVDEEAIEGEFIEIPYQEGPIEITSEALPGGAKVIVHLWQTCGREIHFEAGGSNDRGGDILIDGSIVLKVTRVESDAGYVEYERRSYGR